MYSTHMFEINACTYVSNLIRKHLAIQYHIWVSSFTFFAALAVYIAIAMYVSITIILIAKLKNDDIAYCTLAN